MSIQEIHLNQIKWKNMTPSIHAVYGDTGRELRMILDDVTVESDMTGSVEFWRSDQSHCGTPATVELSSNSFIANIEQGLTQVGNTEAQLKVTKNGLTTSTYTFIIVVHESSDGVPVTQEGETLADALERATDALDQAEGLLDRAETFEPRIEEIERMIEILQVDPDDLGLYQNPDSGYVYPTYKGEPSSNGIPLASGGGGGGGSTAILTVANTTGWLATTISETDQCVLSFAWSSVEDDFPTGDGQMTVRVNGIQKVVQNIQQGSVSINIRDYLSSGSNVVRVTFNDVASNTRSITFSISLVALSISADAFATSNASAVYDGAVTFNYVPVGAVTKTVVFKLDNSIIGTQEVTTSGRQQTFTIPYQAHGAHSLEVYFTAIINETTVSSNHLFFDLIFVNASETTPIIASPFNADGATQFYTLAIPYRVYTPGSAESEVSFTATLVDEEQHSTTTDLGTRTVGRSMQTFTYTPNRVGTLTLTITTGSVSKAIELSVARLDIDVEAETNSLELYLSAEGRSNAEARPGTWTFNDISCEFTDFNFVSDGWQLDEDSSTYLKVSGNARLTIPFQIFANDFKGTGKTIEFDFSTTDVMDYDTTIVSCFSDSKGLRITPQAVSLASESTSISTQYKEDEHVRICFVIEKTSEHRLIYTYINGICSGIVQYPVGDDFQQTNPVGITIGSNLCTMNLYTIRVYNNSLTRHQALNNWIADTPAGSVKLARYNHNNIYDEYGEIVINKLPSNLPYLIIESATLPQYKGDKKTISGSYTNPLDPTKSYTFTKASIDVQGTSSAGYPRKNYKIKYKNFTNEDGETSSVYYLRGALESLPTNVFCYKADYASSEGANNVELVRLYNDACPYKTEPQQSSPLVRQGIDGVPILIFWNDTNAGTISFLGKYNANFDKSSDVFGMTDGDESWETKDNSNDWALFKKADYTGSDWESAFEARYPDDYNNPANLSQVAQWINSTDPEQAPYDTRIADKTLVLTGGGYSNNGTQATNESTNIYSLLGTIETPVYKYAMADIEAYRYYDPETGSITDMSNTLAISVGCTNVSIYANASQNGYSTTGGNANVYGRVEYNDGSNTFYKSAYLNDVVNSTGTSRTNFNFFSTTTTSSMIQKMTTVGVKAIIPIFADEIDNYYLYWGNNSSSYLRPLGVMPGDIIYAGKNTPYYCMKNINDATPIPFAEPIIYGNVEYTHDTPDYRLAKFRNELTNWFNRDDVLFYYLFTELFLMVDSRVKNSFPTLYASHQGAKWCWLPYDMDTAIGINNEGALAFDYSLEDTDMISPTAGVYNGYQTVMWNNVRRCFPKELESLYQSVRAEGIISYDEIERRFEEHQNTWNEAIYNEDAYFKYVKPFIEDGENNLYMCLGSKAEQRKWWLYNRFRYIDSKYTAGLATSSTLQMRVYQKSDLTITPYADIYAGALFDSNLVKQRAPRGQATTLQSPAAWNPGGADAVLRIYSADQIKSLGDLSGFYVGAVSFAGATKLQEVKLGDASPLYQNHNLTEVTFGTNKLLKTVDIRNCPNLTSNIDFSHCENLEILHLEGTSVTGVSLADGGIIRELYLPDTVTNLTLKNLPYLSTFELNDMSNLTTLWLENIDDTIVDGLDVVFNDMADGGRVRITGINKTFDTDADFTALMRKMMAMRGIDTDGNNLPDAYLQGEVTVGEVARYIYDNLYRWPFLTVHYDTIGAYDYVLHLENSTAFTEYHDNVITNIRPYAFYGSNVQVVDTPNVTSIGTNAFQNSKLESINAPLVTGTIGTSAFEGCNLLQGVNFPMVTAIGPYAFRNDTSLTHLHFENVTSMYNSSSALYGCSNLETVVFRKNVTLGTNTTTTFGGNGKLSAFDMLSMDGNPAGNNWTIKANEFKDDHSLTTLVIRKPSGVQAILSGVFTNTPLTGYNGSYSGHVYVPEDLIESYKVATNWSTMYANYPDIFKSVESTHTDPDAPIDLTLYYADGTPIPQEENNG